MRGLRPGDDRRRRLDRRRATARRRLQRLPRPQLLADVADDVESGVSRTVIETVYPLVRVAEPHRALSASRRPGKVVLTTTD